jgi:predicted cobalt transporter CbtA
MGLVRGIARTAVVAGTATAVSNRVSRRQANKWGAQDQQAAEAQAYEQQQAAAQQQAYAAPPAPPAAPAAPAQDDTLAQLQKLGELKAAGVLTEEEFAAQKAKILAG